MGMDDGDVVSRVLFMPQLGSSWAWCGVVWCHGVGGGRWVGGWSDGIL
jgi:hypothetical protein